MESWSTMNILGCDLSLRSSGLVLLNPKNELLWSELIKPDDKMRGMDRVVWLAGQYHLRLQTLKNQFGPMDLVIEDLAKGSKQPYTLVALCQGSTAFQMMAHLEGYRPILVSASHCRKWLTGNGHADKVFVAQRIKIDYAIEFAKDPGYDLSDGCLLALWGNRKK